MKNMKNFLKKFGNNCKGDVISAVANTTVSLNS